MAYISEVREALRAGAPKSSEPYSLIRQIVEVLLEMGGSAHRDAVIDRIALRRGAARASQSLAQEVELAFDRHRARAKRRNEPPLVCLPFGEGSRRWGVVSQPAVTELKQRIIMDLTIEPKGFNDGARVMATNSAAG
jgi:hypothetical protein